MKVLGAKLKSQKSVSRKFQFAGPNRETVQGPIFARLSTEHVRTLDLQPTLLATKTPSLDVISQFALYTS